MTLTERLDAVLDKADAVYANDSTLGAKVDELHTILVALVVAVKELDARTSGS